MKEQNIADFQFDTEKSKSTGRWASSPIGTLSQEQLHQPQQQQQQQEVVVDEDDELTPKKEVVTPKKEPQDEKKAQVKKEIAPRKFEPEYVRRQDVTTKGGMAALATQLPLVVQALFQQIEALNGIRTQIEALAFDLTSKKRSVSSLSSSTSNSGTTNSGTTNSGTSSSSMLDYSIKGSASCLQDELSDWTEEGPRKKSKH